MPYAPTQPDVESSSLRKKLVKIQDDAIDARNLIEMEEITDFIDHSRGAILRALDVAEQLFRLTYETVKRGAFLEERVAEVMREIERRLSDNRRTGHTPFWAWDAHANLHL